eukprot:GDKJ01048741.1.p1 GENE.GDKJ01048741.1~~GDKJ01048741.1.p1  ORF type:complete len:2218 (-),score=526.02 GDKJ01048741.1:1175-7828(-)
MDRGVFVQFPPLQEGFFTVMHGLRPKFEFEKINKLSFILSHIGTLLRFIIEFLQFLPLVTLRPKFFRCKGWFSCGLQILSYPLNSAASESEIAHVIVQIVMCLVFSTLSIIFLVSALNLRKRDLNVSRFRMLSYVFSILILVYYTDIMVLSLRSYFCFSSSETQSGGVCSNPLLIVNSISASILLISALPLAFFSILLSPQLDFKRLSGRVTSIRMDLWSQVLKFILPLNWIIISSFFFPDTDVADFSSGVKAYRIASFAVFVIIYAFFTVAQLLQSTHTRSFDNRLRACMYGGLFGVSIVCFIESILVISAEPGSPNASGFDHSQMTQAVVGVVIGFMCAGTATARQKRLGKFLQRDINLLTDAFDPEYASRLIDILRSCSDEELAEKCWCVDKPIEDNEFKYVTSIKDGNFTFSPSRTNHSANAVQPNSFGTASRHRRREGTLTNAPHNLMFGDMSSPQRESSNNQPSILHSWSPQSGRFKKSALSHARPAVITSSKFEHSSDEQDSKRKIHLNVGPTRINYSPQHPASSSSPTRSHVVVGSDSSSPIPSILRDISWMPEGQQQEDVQRPSPPSDTQGVLSLHFAGRQSSDAKCEDETHNEKCVDVRNKTSAAIHRLFLYMKSQNFVELRKALNFNSDVEMLLHTVSQEWSELAVAQREIARCAILQFFTALYLKSQRNQDRSCHDSYFLWLSATSLSLFNDVELALIGIRIASEGPALSFDTSFLLYLLQKACEDLKNVMTSSKRATGVSDMTAFRRWTSAARLMHEKAIASFKKFFKTFSNSVVQSKVCAEEAEFKIASADKKIIQDCRSSLSDALCSLRTAEEAYDALLSHYPSVPSVQMMVTMFKRQFFREMESSKHDHKTSNTEVVGVNPSACGNGSADVAEKELDDSTSMSETASHNSMGSGLADTPKQAKIAMVKDSVSRSFSNIRYWSFSTLLIVVSISTILLIISLLEIRKVDKWIEVFFQIGQVFVVIPTTCVSINRPLLGSRVTARDFSDSAKEAFDYMYDHDNNPATPNIKLIEGLEYEGAQGLIAHANNQNLCIILLQVIPTLNECYIAYKDSHTNSAYYRRDRATGNVILSDTQYYLINRQTGGANKESFKWWDVHTDLIATGDLKFSNRRQVNGYAAFMQNGEYFVQDVFSSIPMFFWPPGGIAGNSEQPPFQGVFALFATPTPNDRMVYYWWAQMGNVAERLVSFLNSLQSIMLEMDITTLKDSLEQPDYLQIEVYDQDLVINQVKNFNFFEGLTYIASLTTQAQSYMEAYWDETILEQPLVRTLNNFCQSRNIDRIEGMLSDFDTHLHSVVRKSEMIIIICACIAVVATFLGALITIFMIRKFLKEFDRCDGVNPSLAMMAVLPKNELRRMAKAFNALRIDRGVFDPDDERAAFLDLMVNRKTQKVQDALLKANQAAFARDRELDDELLEDIEHQILPSARPANASPANLPSSNVLPLGQGTSKQRHVHKTANNKGSVNQKSHDESATWEMKTDLVPSTNSENRAQAYKQPNDSSSTQQNLATQSKPFGDTAHFDTDFNVFSDSDNIVILSKENPRSSLSSSGQLPPNPQTLKDQPDAFQRPPHSPHSRRGKERSGGDQPRAADGFLFASSRGGDSDVEDGGVEDIDSNDLIPVKKNFFFNQKSHKSAPSSSSCSSEDKHDHLQVSSPHIHFEKASPESGKKSHGQHHHKSNSISKNSARNLLIIKESMSAESSVNDTSSPVTDTRKLKKSKVDNNAKALKALPVTSQQLASSPSSSKKKKEVDQLDNDFTPSDLENFKNSNLSPSSAAKKPSSLKQSPSKFSPPFDQLSPPSASNSSVVAISFPQDVGNKLNKQEDSRNSLSVGSRELLNPFSAPTTDGDNTLLVVNNRNVSPLPSSALPPHVNSHENSKNNGRRRSVQLHNFDEEASVTSRKSPNTHFLYSNTFFRMISTLIRRPISRLYVIIWMAMMTYVAASLIIGIVSVESYTLFYDQISGLLTSSFNFNTSALYFMYYARGQVDYIATNPDQWRFKALDALKDARDSFFNVVDYEDKSGTTFGRRFSEIESLLYSPSCLSLEYPCGPQRSHWQRYSRESYLQSGLVRAVVYWAQIVEALVEAIPKDPDWGPLNYLDAADENNWFPFNALSVDMNDGYSRVGLFLKSHATDQVNQDAMTQLLLIGGGIVTGLVLIVVVELIVRHYMKAFKETLLLLRMLPSRLAHDYKIIEKVLNVQTEDDTA